MRHEGWRTDLTYSDGCLYWAGYKNERSYEGSRAGTLSHNGYRYVFHMGKTYLEHVVIWEILNGPVPEGFELDHRDRDKSNNLIENLRLVTSAQNQQNRGPNKSGSSPFKGVSFYRPTNRWRARIMKGRKAVSLGLYLTEEQAAKAYDAAAKHHFKEFAYLNFPEEETK